MLNKNIISTPLEAPTQPEQKQGKALLDIGIAYIPLLVLGIIGTAMGAGTAAGGATITFGYVFTVIVATWLLKKQGSSWGDLGLRKPESWKRTFLLAFAGLLGAAMGAVLAQIIALNIPGFVTEGADLSRFNPVEGNLALLFGYIFVSWTTVAFGEEMFFRAFLIERISTLFHNSRLAPALAILTSSALFGMAHYQEGPVGMLSTFAIGLVFAGIYVRTGRNLWVTIIAHSLLNTLRFLLIFAGS